METAQAFFEHVSPSLAQLDLVRVRGVGGRVAPAIVDVVGEIFLSPSGFPASTPKNLQQKIKLMQINAWRERRFRKPMRRVLLVALGIIAKGGRQ